MGLGGILLLVAEFGLNLPLVSLLAQKDGDPDAALTQVSLLKGACWSWRSWGCWASWSGRTTPCPSSAVMFLLSAGVGLEALSNSFFVALQVRGRQDLQGKIKALAAGLGFGYGLIALALGAPPLAVAAFKLIESLVNLGGSFIWCAPGAFPVQWPPWGGWGPPCAWAWSLPSSKSRPSSTTRPTSFSSRSTPGPTAWPNTASPGRRWTAFRRWSPACSSRASCSRSSSSSGRWTA